MAQSAHVVLTGSQYPLLNTSGTDSREFTDAIDNLNFALDAVLSVPAGVYLAFHHQLIHAATALKMHTTDLNAFSGTKIDETFQPDWNALTINERHIEKARHFNCMSMMMQPIPPELLCNNLNAIASNPPHVLILQGFGTGNIAVNPEVIRMLQDLQQKGCAVILSTQVTFGGIDQRYAVSQWVADAKILVSNGYSHADLYAKALKMYLQYDSAEQWPLHWQD